MHLPIIVRPGQTLIFSLVLELANGERLTLAYQPVVTAEEPAHTPEPPEGAPRER